MKTMILVAMTVAGAAMAQGKDLRGAYLFNADLQGADFRGANLSKAQLAHANLHGADLRGAKVAGAYLHKADLTGADLRGAEFATQLKGAELSHTNLAGARFDRTTVLPFDDAEAARRGMVKVDATDSPELPATNETQAAGAVASR